MIDFACKQFKLDDVIKCGLGLTKADMKVVKAFMKDATKKCTTENIAKKLELDTSTVQRAVKKLTEKEVLDRWQENLDGGGYIYVYSLKSKDQVRKVIMDIVKNWSSRVEVELNKW